jgi:hypothetical protein
MVPIEHGENDAQHDHAADQQLDASRHIVRLGARAL